jgi:hypothetical protein
VDYQKHYNYLVERAKDRNISGYTEKHHILPKSMGGSNDNDNLVKLSAREHYIAHLLLHKIHGKSETAYALWMMQCKSHNNDGRPHIKNSRMYEWARKEFQKHMTGHGNSKGKKNSQYGTCWVYFDKYNPKSKRIKKSDLIGYLQMGWKKGRVINWDKQKKSTRKDRWDRHKATYEKIANDLFTQFKNSGCSSANEFCKRGFYDKSVVSLTQLWLKYIPEYKENSKQGKSVGKLSGSQALK